MWPFDREERRQFKEWREEKRQLSFIDGYWPEAGAGGQAVASVSRALALVPVFGAVRTLADLVASLTPVLYVNDSRGIPQRQPTPSLFAQPSIHGTLYDWLFRAVVSMGLQGDAIGLITAKDFYGFPTMAEWLNPEQVATNDGKLYGPGSYMNPMWWWWGRPIDPAQLIHIPWFTLPYRVRGLSPIGAYQTTTNVGIGAQEFAQNWFGQGGVPPGSFKNAERVIDHDDAIEITNRLTARLQARKPLVYGRDWEYTPIAIKPHEAQFVETMKLTATQIAVIYGLPAKKLGGTTGESMTYSTTELDNIDLLTMSLRPWLRRFECAFTKLFPRGHYVKFDAHDMLLLDAKTKATVDQMSLGGVGNPWRTADEVRADHDWAPEPKLKPVAPPQPAPPDTDGNGGSDTNGKPPGTDGNGGSPNGKISNTNKALAGARSGQQAWVETMRTRWSNP
jgi:HK97 family phage portal protein